MLGRKVRIQLVAFALIAVVGIVVVAVRYVQLPALLGASGYSVTLSMPATGGAYQDALVSYRGVSVGRVDDIRLTPDGVEATLQIRGDAPRIPRDVEVTVANRSAIGEQFVDLRPDTDEAPWLASGDRLTVAADHLPIPVDALLADIDGFVQSVPKDALSDVVDELSEATRGSAADLQALLDAGRDVTRAADDSFEVTQGLIDNSATVLATQQSSAQDIVSFSESLNLLAGQLQSSDGDLRSLIAATPGASTELKALIDDVGVPLGVLMGNLVTPAQVFSSNAPGLQGVFVRLPEAVSAGQAITGPQGLRVGLVTSFFDPLPCIAGYAGTDLRGPEDVTGGQALNTAARCTPPAGSGTAVRGSSAAFAAAPDTGPAPAVALTEVRSLADLMGGS